MNIPFLLIVVFFLNAIIGAVVLAFVDKDERLYEWYHSAPSDFWKVAVLELWFIVLFVWLRGHRKESSWRQGRED